jgi:16S rRNA (cytosine1402-N4)-methyltransferase
MRYHDPVMLKEAIGFLKIDKKGIYVDVTFGGGGHSRAILNELGEEGRLVGFDRDKDAKGNTIDDKRFELVSSDYRYLKKYLKFLKFEKIDGLLADLGVSSYQIDTPDRGFSYQYLDALLDMRMNSEQEISAVDILHTYDESDLQKMFSNYAQLRNAKTVARVICQERANRNFKTVREFLEVLSPLIMGNRNRYLAQVFQALRIEVNREMESLEIMLESLPEVVKPGGRVVVITYHSVEDGLVKRFFKNGNFDTEPVKDEFGNKIVPWRIIEKKGALPTQDEISRNPRARSARMRIAELK